MTQTYHQIIRRHCRRLEPLATGVERRLHKLDGLRAVLFDVYGTMFISASGEIGTAAQSDHSDAFSAALGALGLACEMEAKRGAECLSQTILRQHEVSRSSQEGGIDYPEVDIIQVWRETLGALAEQGELPTEALEVDLNQLAVEYEVRANPVWPMPGLVETLRLLRDSDMALGIVSNAQFFTIELFPALLSESVESLGFDSELQFYSYIHHRAKPGDTLFRLAEESLASRGIRADETLYVGNDMLNDVLPASRMGFRTALFAGDARSLRLRTGDERIGNVAADVVITDLADLNECIFDTP